MDGFLDHIVGNLTDPKMWAVVVLLLAFAPIISSIFSWLVWHENEERNQKDFEKRIDKLVGKEAADRIRRHRSS